MKSWKNRPAVDVPYSPPKPLTKKRLLIFTVGMTFAVILAVGLGLILVWVIVNWKYSDERIMRGQSYYPTTTLVRKVLN